jgi:hypothetical protein
MKAEKILAIGMALTMLFSINVIVDQAEAASPPAISFVYDDSSKTITISSVESGLYYSNSSSGDDANLVFVRDDDQFYHYVDNNMSVTSSNPASTEEIEDADVISGFTPGTWDIYWKPYGSGYSYMTFNVTEEDPPASLPNISFTYDDSLKKITIGAVDPGLYYSDSSNSSDANLIFVRNNETFYRYVVGGYGPLCIATNGPASTKEIEAGDEIGCFINWPGTYNIYWKPYGSGHSYMTFVVTEYDPPSPPNISFTYDDSSKTITISAVDEDLYYSDSSSGNDANLVFIRGNDSFYHYVDTNMLITSSNPASTEKIESGDVISGFTPGTWDIYWKPSGSGYSYMTFTVTEESQSEDGWIYGTVMCTKENGDEIYLENAKISVILGNNAVASTYTNSNGIYYVYVEPGTYSVEAGKDGYYTGGKMVVVVEEGKGTQVDFSLSGSEFHWAVGWVYGTVCGVANNGTRYLLGNALINVISDNGTVVASTYTRSNGSYHVYVEPGTYSIEASKDGYQTMGKMEVIVESGEGTEVDFNLSESEFHWPVCWVYGKVYVRSGSSIVPLANATVSYRIFRELTNDSHQIWAWKVVFTDEDGDYIIELSPGVYELRAGRKRPSSPSKTLEVEANKQIELDFILEEDTSTGGVSGIELSNNTELLKAIGEGNVGGEINIWQEDTGYEHEIMIYDSVNIPQIDVEQGRVSFVVSGNESSTGKTIAVNVDSSVFDPYSEIVVEYDGEPIRIAEDINDILNPNNDGSHPEYLIVVGSDGIQLLVSVPHFSEHFITFFSLTPEQVAQFFEYAVIAAVGLIVIAAVVMFRKGKED